MIEQSNPKTTYAYNDGSWPPWLSGSQTFDPVC
jgi:hypothetical protein